MREECPHCESTTDSQKIELTRKRNTEKEQAQDSEAEVEELRKLWKTHTMQQTKQQRENMQQDSQKEISQKTVTSGDGQSEGEPVFVGMVLAFICALENWLYFPLCGIYSCILFIFHRRANIPSLFLRKPVGRYCLGN